MARRRRGRIGGVLLALGLPLLLVALLLCLPVVLPIVGRQMAREERRRRAQADVQPCGWCLMPLGVEALARADALHAARIAHEHDGEPRMLRMVRDLHACCPRCDAGHRYLPAEDRFALLDPREFADPYGAALDAVPPRGADLAWPWLRLLPAPPVHRIALAWPGVERATALPAEVEVPGTADVAALAEALLRAIPPVPAGDDAWETAGGGVRLLFGRRAGLPFVRRVGPAGVRAGEVATLAVRPGAVDAPDATFGPAGAFAGPDGG